MSEWVEFFSDGDSDEDVDVDDTGSVSKEKECCWWVVEILPLPEDEMGAEKEMLAEDVKVVVVAAVVAAAAEGVDAGLGTTVVVVVVDMERRCWELLVAPFT